jgi:hypothetical protein
VGNAITQADFGNQPRQYVDYDAVRAAMRAVDNFVLHAANAIAVLPKPIAVAMPRIGAGFGGGDWSVIVQIIEDETGGLSVVSWPGRSSCNVSGKNNE